jgi:hypothetical protein
VPNPKELFKLTVGTNQVALLTRQREPISSILGTIGWVEVPENAEITEAIVAEGIEEAMEKGCFPVALTYRVSPRKKQRAIVLCAPSTADTALEQLVGMNYSGKPIVKATPVRRIQYTY